MIYLDSSVVVSLFVRDTHSDRVAQWIGPDRVVWISRWTVTEFTSAMSHYVRTGRLSPAERDRAEYAFDRWLGRREAPLPVLEEHFSEARALMRRHPRLRAPDALHLSIAQAHRMIIATLDNTLAEAAISAGIEAASL